MGKKVAVGTRTMKKGRKELLFTTEKN